MPLPFAESTPEQPSGPYGWVVAGIVLLLGAIGTFWTAIRGGRREDSTTALTHANRIIAGYERYVGKQDVRIAGLEQRITDQDDVHRKDNDALWLKLSETELKEKRCLLRLQWLCDQMRSRGIEIPQLPFDDMESGGVST